MSKPAYILGISAFYHDSAACLLREGEIIACVQEERFTRKKHDFSFPLNSIKWCLNYAQISEKDLDLVVFYDKPLIKFERILETSLASVPFGLPQFIQAVPLWLKEKLWIPELIRKKINYKGKILFCEHHESHAASAFFPSYFSEAAILTLDGVGEWDTASVGIGKDNDFHLLYSLRFPHSLGLLYSTFTYYIGFKVNSGEYKLMGLAPYGEPIYKDLILKKLIDLKEDGSFKLNMSYFGFASGLKMTNRKFEKLFKSPARKPETPLTQKEMDIAASIQAVTEEIILRMAFYTHKVTGKDNLCLAGGVALNCVANGRILKEGPFKDIWIQPASGDAGGALGAALLGWHKYLGKPRIVDGKNDLQKGSFLGPEFEDQSIESFLKKEEAVYQKVQSEDLPAVVSQLLISGNVVGWFQGRLEFGPRALGARSIIADARNPKMQSKLNLKIKFRESFRPFAPTVLEEEVSHWFELDRPSPYMLLVAKVAKDKRLDNENEDSLKGFEKLKLVRSVIPAVTHVDYSCRVQSINRRIHPLFYDTISEFYRRTGCPVIINTSFNVRGEPLVLSPEDAFRCFMHTEMDYLVMGSFILDKRKQKTYPQQKRYSANFELD